MNVFPAEFPRPPVRHVKAGAPPAPQAPEQFDTRVSPAEQQEDEHEPMSLRSLLLALGLFLLVGVPFIGAAVRALLNPL